jgi:hypothetical protein
MEHTVTATEAAEVIAAYTANMKSGSPDASPEVINLQVAAAFTKYLAAAADPGKYAYFPHPYTEAETILHHAADYLLTAAYPDVATVTPVAVHTVPDEARTDFAAFSAFLDSIPVVA